MSKFTARRNSNPVLYPKNKTGTKTTENILEAWMWNRRCDVSNWLRGKNYHEVWPVDFNQAVNGNVPVQTNPTPTNSVPTKKKVVTHIAIILDASTSMDGLTRDTIKACDNLISNIVDEANKLGDTVEIDIYSFSYTVNTLYRNLVNTKISINDKYRCSGNTALRDCVIFAVRDLNDKQISLTADNAYAVYVITDGCENCSKNTVSDYQKVVFPLLTAKNWTFAGQCPSGYKEEFIKQLSFPVDNVNEWDGHKVVEAVNVTSKGFTNYLVSRSSGGTQSLNFYKTDLSGVSDKDLSKLTNVSGEFSIVEVPKESRINEVFEQKSKKPYVPSEGKAFYMLQKTEKVQSYKQVLVRDKATDKLFSGTEARKLIGLPDNKDCKVEPFNHSHFEVFVQSTSVNRILPRGTKLAIKK